MKRFQYSVKYSCGEKGSPDDHPGNCGCGIFYGTVLAENAEMAREIAEASEDGLVFGTFKEVK